MREVQEGGVGGEGGKEERLKVPVENGRGFGGEASAGGGAYEEGVCEGDGAKDDERDGRNRGAEEVELFSRHKKMSMRHSGPNEMVCPKWESAG